MIKSFKPINNTQEDYLLGRKTNYIFENDGIGLYFAFLVYKKKNNDNTIPFKNFIDIFFNNNGGNLSNPHYIPLPIDVYKKGQKIETLHFDQIKNNKENKFLPFLLERIFSEENSNLINVITGISGIGKSSTLLGLAYYGEKEGYLNVYLDMRDDDIFDIIKRSTKVTKDDTIKLFHKNDNIETIIKYSPNILFIIDINTLYKGDEDLNNKNDLDNIINKITALKDLLSKNTSNSKNHRILIAYRGSIESFKENNDLIYEKFSEIGSFFEVQPIINIKDSEKYLKDVSGEKGLNIYKKLSNESKKMIQTPIFLDFINYLSFLENLEIDKIESETHLYHIFIQEILFKEMVFLKEKKEINWAIFFKSNTNNYIKNKNSFYSSLKKEIHPIEVILISLSVNFGNKFTYDNAKDLLEKILSSPEYKDWNQIIENNYAIREKILESLIKNTIIKELGNDTFEFFHPSFADYLKNLGEFYSFKNLNLIDTTENNKLFDYISSFNNISIYYKDNNFVNFINLLNLYKNKDLVINYFFIKYINTFQQFELIFNIFEINLQHNFCLLLAQEVFDYFSDRCIIRDSSKYHNIHSDEYGKVNFDVNVILELITKLPPKIKVLFYKQNINKDLNDFFSIEQKYFILEELLFLLDNNKEYQNAINYAKNFVNLLSKEDLFYLANKIFEFYEKIDHKIQDKIEFYLEIIESQKEEFANYNYYILEEIINLLEEKKEYKKASYIILSSIKSFPYLYTFELITKLSNLYEKLGTPEKIVDFHEDFLINYLNNMEQLQEKSPLSIVLSNYIYILKKQGNIERIIDFCKKQPVILLDRININTIINLFTEFKKEKILKNIIIQIWGKGIEDVLSYAYSYSYNYYINVENIALINRLLSFEEIMSLSKKIKKNDNNYLLKFIFSEFFEEIREILFYKLLEEQTFPSLSDWIKGRGLEVFCLDILNKNSTEIKFLKNFYKSLSLSNYQIIFYPSELHIYFLETTLKIYRNYLDENNNVVEIKNYLLNLNKSVINLYIQKPKLIEFWMDYLNQNNDDKKVKSLIFYYYFYSENYKEAIDFFNNKIFSKDFIIDDYNIIEVNHYGIQIDYDINVIYDEFPNIKKLKDYTLFFSKQNYSTNLSILDLLFESYIQEKKEKDFEYIIPIILEKNFTFNGIATIYRFYRKNNEIIKLKNLLENYLNVKNLKEIDLELIYSLVEIYLQENNEDLALNLIKKFLSQFNEYNIILKIILFCDLYKNQYIVNQIKKEEYFKPSKKIFSEKFVKNRFYSYKKNYFKKNYAPKLNKNKNYLEIEIKLLELKIEVYNFDLSTSIIELQKTLAVYYENLNMYEKALEIYQKLFVSNKYDYEKNNLENEYAKKILFLIKKIDTSKYYRNILYYIKFLNKNDYSIVIKLSNLLKNNNKIIETKNLLKKYYFLYYNEEIGKNLYYLYIPNKKHEKVLFESKEFIFEIALYKKCDFDSLFKNLIISDENIINRIKYFNSFKNFFTSVFDTSDFEENVCYYIKENSAPCLINRKNKYLEILIYIFEKFIYDNKNNSFIDIIYNDNIFTNLFSLYIEYTEDKDTRIKKLLEYFLNNSKNIDNKLNFICFCIEKTHSLEFLSKLEELIYNTSDEISFYSYNNKFGANIYEYLYFYYEKNNINEPIIDLEDEFSFNLIDNEFLIQNYDEKIKNYNFYLFLSDIYINNEQLDKLNELMIYFFNKNILFEYKYTFLINSLLSLVSKNKIKEALEIANIFLEIENDFDNICRYSNIKNYIDIENNIYILILMIHWGQKNTKEFNTFFNYFLSKLTLDESKNFFITDVYLKLHKITNLPINIDKIEELLKETHFTEEESYEDQFDQAMNALDNLSCIIKDKYLKNINSLYYVLSEKYIKDNNIEKLSLLVTSFNEKFSSIYMNLEKFSSFCEKIIKDNINDPIKKKNLLDLLEKKQSLSEEILVTKNIEKDNLKEVLDYLEDNYNKLDANKIIDFLDTFYHSKYEIIDKIKTIIENKTKNKRYLIQLCLSLLQNNKILNIEVFNIYILEVFFKLAEKEQYKVIEEELTDKFLDHYKKDNLLNFFKIIKFIFEYFLRNNFNDKAFYLIERSFDKDIDKDLVIDFLKLCKKEKKYEEAYDIIKRSFRIDFLEKNAEEFILSIKILNLIDFFEIYKTKRNYVTILDFYIKISFYNDKNDHLKLLTSYYEKENDPQKSLSEVIDVLKKTKNSVFSIKTQDDKYSYILAKELILEFTDLINDKKYSRVLEEIFDKLFNGNYSLRYDYEEDNYKKNLIYSILEKLSELSSNYEINYLILLLKIFFKNKNLKIEHNLVEIDTYNILLAKEFLNKYPNIDTNISIIYYLIDNEVFLNNNQINYEKLFDYYLKYFNLIGKNYKNNFYKRLFLYNNIEQQDFYKLISFLQNLEQPEFDIEYLHIFIFKQIENRYSEYIYIFEKLLHNSNSIIKKSIIFAITYLYSKIKETNSIKIKDFYNKYIKNKILVYDFFEWIHNIKKLFINKIELLNYLEYFILESESENSSYVQIFNYYYIYNDNIAIDIRSIIFYELYFEIDKKNHAINFFKNIIDITIKNNYPELGAKILLLANFYDEEERILLFKNYEKEPNVADKLSQIYLKNNRYDEAEIILKNILNTEINYQDNINFIYNLLKIYQYKNDTENISKIIFLLIEKIDSDINSFLKKIVKDIIDLNIIDCFSPENLQYLYEYYINKEFNIYEIFFYNGILQEWKILSKYDPNSINSDIYINILEGINLLENKLNLNDQIILFNSLYSLYIKNNRNDKLLELSEQYLINLPEIFTKDFFNNLFNIYIETNKYIRGINYFEEFILKNKQSSFNILIINFLSVLYAKSNEPIEKLIIFLLNYKKEKLENESFIYEINLILEKYYKDINDPINLIILYEELVTIYSTYYKEKYEYIIDNLHNLYEKNLDLTSHGIIFYENFLKNNYFNNESNISKKDLIPSWQILFYLNQLYINKKEYEKGLDFFESYLKYNINNQNWRVIEEYLTNLYINSKNYSRGIKFCENYLILYPEKYNWVICNLLNTLYIKNSNYKRGIFFYQNFLFNFPNKYLITIIDKLSELYSLAKIKNKKNREISFYEENIIYNYDTYSLEILKKLNILYIKYNMIEKGIKFFNEYLEYLPQNENENFVYYFLENLKEKSL